MKTFNYPIGDMVIPYVNSIIPDILFFFVLCFLLLSVFETFYCFFLLQSENAFFSINVTDVGIDTRVNKEHFSNELSMISVTEESILIE